MRHIAIIDGHPDPSQARLNHALADRYAKAAQADGHEVRRIELATLDFPLLRTANDFYYGQPPETIKAAQRDIAWADHLVFFYPLWNGDMPALLKGFIEQTFRPGFSMEYGGAMRFPKKLLTGKSARIVVTMGMPAFIYRMLFRARTLRSFEQSILGMCGVAPVRSTLIGGAGEDEDSRHLKWLDRMADLEQRDTAELPRSSGVLRLLAGAGLLLAGGYLTYAGIAWTRYGTAQRSKREDPLLEGAMPDYEVSVSHHVTVNAPAETTFQAIRSEGFGQFPPIVSALFRAREVLLRGRHSRQQLPRGFLEQLTLLGWTILSEEPGREVVLGTVTQPWQPNPAFRALPPEEFARYAEPGYAKIAFALRVEPVGSNACEAFTETRVKTTDPVSRARFRRYWAFLSPGIELIRVSLLQQVKGEAESRVKQAEPAFSP